MPTTQGAKAAADPSGAEEALSRGPALAEGQGHGLFTAASGAQAWAPAQFSGAGALVFPHGAQREVPVWHTGALATRQPSSPWEAVFWCPPDEDAARGEVSHHRAPGTRLASPFGPHQGITKKTQAALHNHVSFRLDSGPEVSWRHTGPQASVLRPHTLHNGMHRRPHGMVGSRARLCSFAGTPPAGSPQQAHFLGSSFASQGAWRHIPRGAEPSERSSLCPLHRLPLLAS